MKNRQPHILLVEDSSDDVELVRLALSDQLIPYRLSIVRDGQEALEFIFNSPVPDLPDLILLDLNMPKVSGHEVLQKLKQEERTKNLPVIIFTNSQGQHDLVKSYNLGASAFIKKALDPNEFKSALKNLDVYWLLK